VATPDSVAKQEDRPPDLVRLGTLPIGEARILAGRLNAEGIEAHVSDAESGVYPSLALEGVDVLVPASQLDDARRVAAGIDEGGA
jgi:hypothetical protein